MRRRGEYHRGLLSQAIHHVRPFFEAVGGRFGYVIPYHEVGLFYPDICISSVRSEITMEKSFNIWDFVVIMFVFSVLLFVIFDPLNYPTFSGPMTIDSICRIFSR
jgi:hypothetical protein